MIQPHTRTLIWLTSRYSNDADNCVQWARVADGVLVGDSKRPDGPTVLLTLDEWRSFLGRVRSDDAVDTGPLRTITGEVLVDGRTGPVWAVWHLWHPRSGVTLRFTAGERDAFLREVRDHGYERTLAA
ncbi:DUF397 domain-containing protein [Saccharopolyspora hattusasensis]|uniref:DUF397 domain-containing protein n=1 Tax=Saccharopolyspora hattusasensis TaxID=1128679 RepID=UPI003D9711F6